MENRNPNCFLVEDSQQPGFRRYLLTGGEITREWRDHLRPPEQAWCEISVWRDGEQIGPYGGSVWPSAWPALFASLPPSAQCGSRTLLTDTGRALLARASVSP